MNKHLFELTGASIALLLLSCLPGCQLNPPKKPPAQGWFDATVSDDFEFETPSPAWAFRTPALWRIAYEGDRRFLQMAIPPEGTKLGGRLLPWEYAVYGKYEFRSFSLSCRVRIDREAAAKGRDACILFGRQDPTHCYCVRLAADSSGDFGMVTRIDGTIRKSLTASTPSRPPVIADRNWHRVDLLRDADSGTIKIYIDADPAAASPAPAFETQDRTYPWGTIALGSFEHHASFARLAIQGQARRPQSTSILTP